MRTRIAAAALLLAAALLFAQYVLTWLQVTPLQELGTDFSSSYVAALLVRAGQGAHLYDQALEQARHLALLPPGTRITLPFLTPPTTAVLALPFTVLGLATASRLFSVLQVAAVVGTVIVTMRAAPWPQRTPAMARVATAAAAAAGVSTLVLLLVAQLDGLSALGMAIGYALWRRGRPSGAGFAVMLGLLALKPHLAVGLAIFLIARRDWRALRGAAVAAAAVAVVSLAVCGPAGLAAYPATLMQSLAATPPASTVGLAGLAASWLGAGGAATAVTVLLMAGAVAGCALIGRASRHRDRLELGLLGAAALSLTLSPHLLPYDSVILAPLFVAAMARAAQADPRGAWPGTATVAGLAVWVGGNLLADIDVGTASAAPPGRLTPVVLVAVAVVAWQTMRPRPNRAPPAPVARRLQLGSGSGVGGSVE